MDYIRETILPEAIALNQNYPNPFNPATTIHFSIANPVHVKISIYNILGQRINTLSNRMMQPGNYHVTWDGRDQFYHPVSSGTYFYMIQAGNFKDIKKMVLLR